VWAQSAVKKNTNTQKSAKARTDSIAKARTAQREALAKARKKSQDSARDARQHAMDSAAAARKERYDSIKLARKHATDSIAAVRKKKSDSIASIRKHKESKKYKDSLAKARNKKLQALKDERTARLDSIRDARQHITDSVTAVRKERIDSIRSVQKHRNDSLAKVKKYKSSKRYTDSVTLVRRHRLDSIKAVQKEYRDSIAAIRKHVLDSVKLVRTKKLDSAKVARARKTDSIAAARKAKTDSLAKKRDQKAKMAKAKEKKKQQDVKLALELKLKQKREEWSNTSMLKKPWGPKRRFFQNSFTHYNYYYNANRKMEEAEMNMRRANRDKYDAPIDLFPFDPNKDSSLLAADMDSIVHKVSVGIQIHDPRIKWGNDMYLLLGRAYYYKGNYENAAISFRYIIANDQKAGKKKGSSHYSRSKPAPSIVDKKKKSKLAFWQHKSVHNDAILWLSRTYATAGQVENAESILSLLEFEKDLPENLTGRLAVEKAFAYLKVANYEEASKQLTIAQDDSYLPSWLKVRIAFLNGQLLADMGSYDEAARSFEIVLGYYPKIEMDFYARKYIASNKLRNGENVAAATLPLKRMLKDGKYTTYYDQVHYVLGQLSAKAGDNEDAISYFKKSTRTPKASRKQKALSFAAMGEVFYAQAQYTDAKAAYDSAAKYGTGVKDKGLASIAQRSAGLSEIAGPVNTIREIDSMLHLASLSKREQSQIARKYLREEEKKIRDSIAAAEVAGASAVAAEAVSGSGTGSTSNWYFSNPALITQGSSDFKRKWGNRQLTDNWRRASAAPLTAGNTATGGGSNADDGDEEDGAIARTENGLPTEAALLSKIPNTKEQQDLSKRIQQKAYILLAKAYIKQLNDYESALHTLDTLVVRYPAHTQKEEELFLRYQIAVKQGKLDVAQSYSNELLSKFPGSQYAHLLRPAKSEAKGADANTKEVAAQFDKTYDLLMKHQYTEARLSAEDARKKYNNALYQKRFQVVEAMAWAGAGNYDMADSVITLFLKSNPNDSLTDWGKSVKKYISEVRNGGKPSWYREDYVPRVHKPATSSATAGTTTPPDSKPEDAPVISDAPLAYSYQADSPHYCIIVLPGLDSRTAQLKQDIRKFDSAKYAAAPLTLLLDFYKMKEAVMIVSGFENAAAAKAYMADLSASAVLDEYDNTEVNILLISARNYKKMFADKSADGYRAFYNVAYNR